MKCLQILSFPSPDFFLYHAGRKKEKYPVDYKLLEAYGIS